MCVEKNWLYDDETREWYVEPEVELPDPTWEELVKEFEEMGI